MFRSRLGNAKSELTNETKRKRPEFRSINSNPNPKVNKTLNIMPTQAKKSKLETSYENNLASDPKWNSLSDQYFYPVRNDKNNIALLNNLDCDLYIDQADQTGLNNMMNIDVEHWNNTAYSPHLIIEDDNNSLFNFNSLDSNENDEKTAN